MASAEEEILRRAYEAFNARDVEAVIVLMHPEVDWPNGMEGGRVRGHAAVRDYWQRQFGTIDSRVEPRGFSTDPTGRVVVDVHQVVRDPDGDLLSEAAVQHVYSIRDGLIEQMEIAEVESGEAAAIAKPDTASEEDLALLRAHEPIVRYTRGELFFPTAVGPYVEACSLWRGEEQGSAERVVAPGDLGLERLCEEALGNRQRPLQLRFVAEPLNRADYRRWRRLPRERLDAGTRFTTTGMFGRLVDAGIRASLLLRGKVAAGLAAAAEIGYRERLEADRFTYYGRVVRDGGYVCLQYWYFYGMNDWRSTFAGINDHEADWEMITVYLAERPEAPPQPAWVAFSSHDVHGDNLRRRWDDPDLVLEGDHPVVFAGAGSHSGAFVSGDYVISVDPPQLRWVMTVLHKAQRLLAPWRDVARPSAGFGIPFVDYARGDGRAIGPGCDRSWTPALIDDETPWVRDYRGLWGLDTEDRFGGERAPAGPRYERDGSIRPSWANPVGWAGLLKVPPTGEDTELLGERVAEMEGELRDLDREIAAGRRAVRGLGAEARSLGAHDYARTYAEARRAEVGERETALNEAIATRTRLAEERRTHLDTLSRPSSSEPPQAHLTKVHGPRVEEQRRRTRLLRFWSVISTPLLLIAVIAILNSRSLASLTAVGNLILLFIAVEAFARRRLVSFIGSFVMLIGLIVVVLIIALLLKDYWHLVLSALLAAAALALLIGNIGDLRHGWRGRESTSDERLGTGD